MKTTIGVFFGGRSTEHEISVLTANQAMAAINRDKYDVVPVYISKDGRWYTGEGLCDTSNYRDIPALLKQCTEVYMRPEYGDYNLYTDIKKLFGTTSKPVATLDVAIPALHGSNGEDGTFQGILQSTGLPFAGCDVLSSANGMDKITMKMILAAEGIPVVDYVWFTDKQWFAQNDKLIARIEEKLGYPVIVKPANLGSSVGIGAAHNREQLLEKVADAERYSTRIIVEHMLTDMQEINCSVLGDCNEYETSVLEEPLHGGDLLTYEEKYMGGGKSAKGGSKQGMANSQKRFPADLDEATTKEVQRVAGETFRTLSCHGVSRVDVMIDRADGKIYVNEINTIPGSFSFYLWEATGVPFDKLMDRLVALALKRKREEGLKTTSFSQNIFAMGGAIGAKGTKGAKRP